MIVFQAILDATNNAFIGQDLMQYSASVQILQATLKGALAPVLVFVGLGITGAIWGYVLALAVAGLHFHNPHHSLPWKEEHSR